MRSRPPAHMIAGANDNFTVQKQNKRLIFFYYFHFNFICKRKHVSGGLSHRIHVRFYTEIDFARARTHAQMSDRVKSHILLV